MEVSVTNSLFWFLSNLISFDHKFISMNFNFQFQSGPKKCFINFKIYLYFEVLLISIGSLNILIEQNDVGVQILFKGQLVFNGNGKLLSSQDFFGFSFRIFWQKMLTPCFIQWQYLLPFTNSFITLVLILAW